MSGAHRESLHAAAAVYRLAARTFAAEVDPPFYRALVEMSQECPPAAPTGTMPLAPQLRQLPDPTAIDLLAVEYCRLFLGPRPACSPYASAYAPGSTLGVPARQALRSFLDDHGVEPQVPPAAPIADDDHAAVCLAALAQLCTRAAADDPGGSAAALTVCRQLRSTYLLGWLPGFLDDVTRHSRCGPYAPVARVTAALLRDETVCPRPLVPAFDRLSA